MVAVMVLAAGLGTRLRPLTSRLAKPLVPVGDGPVIGHVLDRIAAFGAERVVVNVHHRPEDMTAYVTSRSRKVALSHELDLLGTAGGVANARDLLGDGDVLVYNADIWAEVDLRALVAAHSSSAREEPAACATLLVHPLAAGEGSVGYDARGRLVRLRETRVGREDFGGAFLGVHVLGQTLRRQLPPRGCLVGDVYIPALQRGARIDVQPHRGRFFDVGTLGGYLAANLAWLEQKAVPAWLGPRASVDPGVALDGCVVGEGATIRGRGRIERTVVWPGATSTAPVADSIVMPDGPVAVSSASGA
jgi:mannose-1-phosphate guanylyltransferase